MRAVPDTDEWITPAEAAAMLGVSVETIRRHCDTGKLTAHRTLGEHRRILRSTVEAFLPPETEPAA